MVLMQRATQESKVTEAKNIREKKVGSQYICPNSHFPMG
jgi:hypothetical protein